MGTANENATAAQEEIPQDFSFVDSSARIAVYDDLLSSPQIVDIQPNTTLEYITELASKVYNFAKAAGGKIPYSVILQVSENFIHSHFREVVVSIMDEGNTIRFADQGPGIPDKEKAQQPGFSSATSDMKRYINGVGSGLPIVKEYMETKNGAITIEDNLQTGAVVTISVAPHEDLSDKQNAPAMSVATPANHKTHQDSVIATGLSPRDRLILNLFKNDTVLGVKEISEMTEIPQSSTFNQLKKLIEMGIITKIGKKYSISEIGKGVLAYLFE